MDIPDELLQRCEVPALPSKSVKDAGGQETVSRDQSNIFTTELGAAVQRCENRREALAKLLLSCVKK